MVGGKNCRACRLWPGEGKRREPLDIGEPLDCGEAGKKPLSSGTGKRAKSDKARAAVAGRAIVDDASSNPRPESRKQASIAPADGKRNAQSGWRLPSQNRGSAEDHIRCDGFFVFGVCRARRGSRLRRSGEAFPPTREFWRALARSTASAEAGGRGVRAGRWRFCGHDGHAAAHHRAADGD